MKLVQLLFMFCCIFSNPCKIMNTFAVLNCSFEQYMYSSCDPLTQPYFCPSQNICGSQEYSCPGLCYLSKFPPYPPRPKDTGLFQLSDYQEYQHTRCGPRRIVDSEPCSVQPNHPKWPFFTQRLQQCLEKKWWCPKNPLTWRPSKHQCSSPIGNSDRCPISALQTKDCVVSAPYIAPNWAPQPQSNSTYCDASIDCSKIGDAGHCVGCCSWRRAQSTNSTCSPFWKIGKGGQCRQTSPRFNWAITTCDTIGGMAFGQACQQNPFSTVDIRYIAVYQLTRKPTGSFVWRIVPESSLNWDGLTHLVDFSKLPTEFTSGSHGGVINSCSGGGGGWNTAFFAYNVSGVTPPAFMFVLSYERFDNAAWFMLNQRIMNTGPQISTCNACTNCWGESSPGDTDFLEPANLLPIEYRSEDGWKVHRMKTSNPNKCWTCSHSSKNGSRNDAACGGEISSALYDGNDELSPRGHVWAAVVDARGYTVYKDVEWTGITSSCTAPELINLHPKQPSQQQPCNDSKKSCAMYLPGCVTRPSAAMVQITNGTYSRIPQCWYADQALSSTCTENWWNLMVDTGQWIINDPVKQNN